jgi:hypothetical protein
MASRNTKTSIIQKGGAGFKATSIPYYKTRLGRTFLAPNTSTFLQTTLAAAAHLAEGQILHEEQTLKNEIDNYNNNDNDDNNNNNINKTKNFVACSPQAKYTDRATPACRRS